jgi:hypothetical protein
MAFNRETFPEIMHQTPPGVFPGPLLHQFNSCIIPFKIWPNIYLQINLFFSKTSNRSALLVKPKLCKNISSTQQMTFYTIYRSTLTLIYRLTLFINFYPSTHVCVCSKVTISWAPSLDILYNSIVRKAGPETVELGTIHHEWHTLPSSPEFNH